MYDEAIPVFLHPKYLLCCRRTFTGHKIQCMCFSSCSHISMCTGIRILAWVTMILGNLNPHEIHQRRCPLWWWRCQKVKQVVFFFKTLVFSHSTDPMKVHEPMEAQWLLVYLWCCRWFIKTACTCCVLLTAWNWTIFDTPCVECWTWKGGWSQLYNKRPVKRHVSWNR
jgi:hypothetical protein